MIEIPTDPAAHRWFDAAAWLVGLALAFGLHRAGLTPGQPLHRRNPGYLISLALGAAIGAYLVGALPGLVEAGQPLGHSIAGALAGGVLAVELYKAGARVRGSTGGVLVAPLAAGIAVGRLGCLFAGLADGTYGDPTSLPWGVDLGDGVPRHPVQLYESAAMAGFLAVYLVALARKTRWARDHGFHIFVAYYGAQRFTWEFLKPYPDILGPLNPFHFVCLGLIAYGCLWLALGRDGRRETA